MKYTTTQAKALDKLLKLLTKRGWSMVDEYENGYDARREETAILREFKYAKYKGLSLLSTGNSELFDRDILGVDDV